MGFRKPMDYNQVQYQIYMSGVEMNDPRNDGFVTFEIKKDLYKLKWLVDKILKDGPTYAGEQEFIKEYETKLIWDILKK